MKIKLMNRLEMRNAGWLMGGRIAQMVISFAVNLFTARFLGPSNYGLINYAATYISFFMALCTLGINSVLVKEILDHPKKDGEILGTTLVLRIISSVLSMAMMLLVVFFIDAGEKDTMIVVLLCSFSLIFGSFEIFNFWFQAYMNSKVTAIATFIAYCVTSLYRILLLCFGKSVGYFAFATSVDYICVALLLGFAYKKHGGGKLSFSVDCAKRLLKSSYPFILSGLMISVYAQTDKIMLKQMLGVTEVGYYSTAVHICSLWGFVITAIIHSLQPSIVEAFKRSEKEFNDLNCKLYAIVFYLSVILSLITMLTSDILIMILYGSDYSPAAAPLRVVVWYTAFSYLGGARDIWIVCKKKQKYMVLIYGLAAVINVVLNFVFIPIWGASGAALASLCTQVFSSIVLPFIISPLRENSLLMLDAISMKLLKRRK